MTLIRNANEWAIIQGNLKQKYNAPDDTTVIGAPREYPCLFNCSFFADPSGYRIKCSFLYVKEAQELVDAKRELDLLK